jgi:plastocyanin
MASMLARSAFPSVPVAVGVLALAGAVQAATVRGTVVIPQAGRAAGERFPSFWPRLENGLLPIGPPLVSALAEALVVLEGATTSASWSGNVVMELAGSDFSPRLVPVLTGTTVEFKNVDRLAYTLYSPEHTSFFGREETLPGRSRKIKFLAQGAFAVRCEEFPHMEGAILVLQSNLFARPDERGGFRIENVPEGRYTVRVFFRGSYVHQQTIEVGKSSLDLTLKLPASPPAARKAD